MSPTPTAGEEARVSQASEDCFPASDSPTWTHGATSRHPAPRESRVEAWIPDYESLGFSRREAVEVARIAARLWGRYTALGLTIDSANPTPTALDPFEVLVQAAWHFGVRRMLSDGRRPGRGP
jgi:hypothetical protein